MNGLEPNRTRRSSALSPSPLSHTSTFTYMDITYGPDKSVVKSTQPTNNQDLPPPPSSAPPTSFRIRRGHDWVDPGGPFQPPYTPTGTLPANHEAYSSWLHEHHAITLLAADEMQGADRDTQGQNSQDRPKSNAICTLPRAACASAFDDARTATPKLYQHPSSPARRRWTPPWRRPNAGGKTITTARPPTFRVWEPHPPSSSTPVSSLNTPHPPGPAVPEGHWVAYPSVVTTEGPLPADEARYRAQVAKGFRRTGGGGRKCQPGLPRWMSVAIIVSLPVLLPVGMGLVALESGQEWWKERGKEKVRKRKVKANEKARREAEEEELARWKMDGWWDEDDE